MKRTIFFTALMASVVFGTMAQTTPQGTPAQTTPQSTPGTTVPQNAGNRTSTTPYMGQGTYNSMDMNRIPQNIQSSFGTDYSGVTGATWEYNNDVYRSSFTQDGKNRSVLYGQDGRMIETRTSTNTSDLPSSVQSALKKQNATSAYEIQVGDNTYYSTQVGGKEMYFDSKGSAVKMPKR
ncbi:hypothetical protein GCM10027275_25620 [Rhabdobacter roseus]|uniref:Beta-lactamase-inhibitor-like PepSY-like domain-containing protein n=1 Tax=Rhabdobacter roseus TaxID=1655419 RepID=A0A840TS23_9BACT|nr:hypothetical protein [Rhabdobacter roseus]MBB5284507.1 hypothetical protein [Rhabdobacter roseus]